MLGYRRKFKTITHPRTPQRRWKQVDETRSDWMVEPDKPQKEPHEKLGTNPVNVGGGGRRTATDATCQLRAFCVLIVAMDGAAKRRAALSSPSSSSSSTSSSSPPPPPPKKSISPASPRLVHQRTITRWVRKKASPLMLLLLSASVVVVRWRRRCGR